MYRMIAGFILILSPMSLTAAEDEAAAAGAGTSSCGAWLDARGRHDRDIDDMLASWVQGFLSGMNIQRRMLTKQDLVAIPDPPTLLAYIDKFCRDQPLKITLQGALQLYKEIQVNSPQSNNSLERTRKR